MEEGHIPTDHLNKHNARRQGDDDAEVKLDQAMTMNQKLQDIQTQEMIRILVPSYDKEYRRFRGICFEKGNAVFTDTPVEPPSYRKPLSLCQASYEWPCQHPMYKTSNQYGQQPFLAHTPLEFHARDITFTSLQSTGGMYEDCHLTTELDKQIV